MKNLFLIDSNRKCMFNANKLSDIVAYVRSKDYDEYGYDIFTVRQGCIGEDDTLEINLSEIIEAYNNGERPEDLYFF